MKKMFTKLFSASLIMALALISFAGKAQTTSLTNNAVTTVGTTATSSTPLTTAAFPNAGVKAKADSAGAGKTETKAAVAQEDTTWHPQRRLWGYTFGDFYYDAHSPALTSTQGKENNYYLTPTYRNAFQFRRLYLGYDYEINKKFKAEVLLASEPTANTAAVSSTNTISNSDNLADNKMSFYIKNFNIRDRDLWTGTDFVIGELSTPSFALNEPGTNAPTSLSETTWGYRSIERTITDFHKNNSYDVGAALQGTFDPATKNFGYVLMVGDNTQASLLSAANANTGFYKMFYGDLWGKFFDQHLYIDFYFDALKTAPATAQIGAQSHSMDKVFVAYVSKNFAAGVEAYTQQMTNGVENTTTKAPENATVNAISLWVRGAINPGKLGYFARYDGYNPDTQFGAGDTYSVNTNYSSYDPTEKEKFITAGLDFTPAKNVHFMPNLWFVQYTDQLAATSTGYLPDNHTLVYRLTFFYTFGK